jgi:hypothetical protein
VNTSSMPNGGPSNRRIGPPAEPVGTRDLLRLAVSKLSSQSLLFGLAMAIVLTPLLWQLQSPSLVVASAMLISLAALFGYLFIEQKRNVERAEPVTMNQLMRNTSQEISNAHSSLTLRVWTKPKGRHHLGTRDMTVTPRGSDRTGYHVGDKVVVFFQANKDCYLTLLNIGSSGNLTILYPNTLHSDNRISANRVYEIPGAEYGFDFELLGPPGVEKIKAIATVDQLRFLESDFKSDGSLFRTLDPTQGARSIRVIQRELAALSKDGWAESECEFTVAQTTETPPTRGERQ